MVDEYGRTVGESPGKDCLRKRIFKLALNRPLQRTRTELGIVADVGKVLLGSIGHLKLEPASLHPAGDRVQLYIGDRKDMLSAEAVKGENLVDTVQKLRPEARLQDFGDFRLYFLDRKSVV